MLEMAFWILIVLAICALWLFLLACIRSKDKPTPAEKTVLRVFSNGRLIIGPISLNELATMARYGSFEKDASILYLGYDISSQGVDMSLEYAE